MERIEARSWQETCIPSGMGPSLLQPEGCSVGVTGWLPRNMAGRTEPKSLTCDGALAGVDVLRCRRREKTRDCGKEIRHDPKDQRLSRREAEEVAQNPGKQEAPSRPGHGVG